jgi:hypothetical protein
MDNEAFDPVYTFVEQAYIRLQAGDVLYRCVEASSSSPMQNWVEGLVFAGPDNLRVLREILAETSQHRTLTGDDLGRVYHGLEAALKDFGLQLVDLDDALALSTMTTHHFMARLQQQGIEDEQDQIACLRQLQAARQNLATLAARLRILQDIEIYLSDWFRGLAYQQARQEQSQIVF